ncbi:ABC transporter substrate-binding protein [Nocardiopsis suaedae]|uniref:ABC transporter substrate-binding protein n=1 Tax=Nocardiopsis suaedae TaxID=3018444 RepID=A0ABT4TNG8_9ACTN|nr:ABC transporter substrate-binding protein [Nocardiopsis suaedae]MDA2806231.1 ABC transporter substrate-binding protein [Nocardiopsis suaedae]
MTRRHLPPVAAAAAAAVLLAACAAPDGGRDDGCPPRPDLDAPPERVVTMDGGSAALLTELGVGGTVVGTAAPDFFDAFPADERAAFDRIPVVDEGTGNREAVIAAEPDLVMGVSSYQFGAFDGTPTAEELAAAGIAAHAACDPPGTTEDLSATYAFIEDTAEVFGVPGNGAALTARMRERVGRAASGPGAGPVRVLSVSVVPGSGQGVSTVGGRGTANGVITLAGGENIAGDVPLRIADLSPEEVVRRDPEAILVLTGFSGLSGRELVDAVLEHPVLSRTTAAREERFAVLPQSIVTSPSVLNAEAVADLSEALHGAGGRP